MNQQAGIIWSSSDPLFSAVEETKVLLEQIHLSFELTNGNVEKELKLLVAGALRGASHPYRESYLSVRDKAVNGKAIDLLALTSLRDGRKAAPAFWAEFKCSFREAGTDAVFAVATEALAQVWRYS